ncbi:MAG: hypothetical protein V4496_07255 [Pseudomonadota bacterium]
MKMTIEQLDQLNSAVKAQVATAKGLTATATALCSFIRKLEKTAQPQAHAYEKKRVTYLNETYTALEAHLLKVKTFFEHAPQRFHLENNEETHEDWQDVSFDEMREKTKKANTLIKHIDHTKRRWRELQSRIEYLPESSQKNNFQTLLETILPLVHKLDELKISLDFFGLRQKYYILTHDIDEEYIAFKDATKIMTDSIGTLQNIREKIQEKNTIEKIDQLIGRFQTLMTALPDAASRQNSTKKQTTFSSQDNNIIFIERAYSLLSSQSSQSTEIDMAIPQASSSNIANNVNTLVGSHFGVSPTSSTNNRKRKASDSAKNSF